MRQLALPQRRCSMAGVAQGKWGTTHLRKLARLHSLTLGTTELREQLTLSHKPQNNQNCSWLHSTAHWFPKAASPESCRKAESKSTAQTAQAQALCKQQREFHFSCDRRLPDHQTISFGHHQAPAHSQAQGSSQGMQSIKFCCTSQLCCRRQMQTEWRGMEGQF